MALRSPVLHARNDDDDGCYTIMAHNGWDLNVLLHQQSNAFTLFTNIKQQKDTLFTNIKQQKDIKPSISNGLLI